MVLRDRKYCGERRNCLLLVMKYIGCLLLVMIYAVHQITSDTRHCRHGRIDPVQPYFLEKEDLILECWRNGSTGNLSFIYGQGRKEKTFDEKFIANLNSSYAKACQKVSLCGNGTDYWSVCLTSNKLKIPSISRKMVRRYGPRKFVACRDSVNTSLCMDNVYVRLEYYPRKVRNDECVLLNFKTLSCTWSHRVQYKYMGYIKTTSHFQFLISPHQSLHQSNWIPCPNSSNSFCYWSEEELSSVGIFSKFGVQISVVNTKRNISSILKKSFHRDDIVKPSPVKNLTFTSTRDPTCVLLSWQQDWSVKKFLHNITLQSKCGSIQIIQTECSKMNCSYQIHGIIPYTSYNVSYISRYFPNGVEKGFWSDTVYLHFISEKNAPYKSPSVTDGLYIYGRETLTVFLKPLDECERHSNDTVYVLSNNRFEKTISSETFQLNLYVEAILQEFDSVVMQISAVNQFGTSEASSVLEINRQTDVPLDSELIVKYKREVDGTAPEYIATIIPDETNLINYKNLTHTLTWCEKDDSERCKSYMRWLEIEENSSTVVVPVKNAYKSYKFGLITKGIDKSTSKMSSTDIEFVQCVYGYNLAPYKALPFVRLPDVISPYSLAVEWEEYECQGREFNVPYIENYVVTYCTAEEPPGNNSCYCSSEEVTISVSRKVKRYKVPDVDPDRGYCIWVAANNTSGLGPKNSQSLYHVVTHKVENTIVIAVSVVISVIVVGIALICLVHHKVIPRVKSWYRGLQKVEVPDITKYEKKDLTTPIDVMDNSSGIYVNIGETNLDNVDNDKDSAIYDSAAPLLGYDSTRSIQTDNESVKSQLSDLSHKEDLTESINTEQGSDRAGNITKVASDQFQSYNKKGFIEPPVNPVATFSDNLKSIDEINTEKEGFEMDRTLGTESVGVRSDTEQKNHSIKAASTNMHESFESRCDYDEINPNANKMFNPTVSENPQESTFLDEGNSMLDLNTENNSDNESVCLEWNQGSHDGYAHIPLKVVISDDEDDFFVTNIPQDNGEKPHLQQNKDNDSGLKPCQELQQSEKDTILSCNIEDLGLDGNHDFNLNVSRGVICDFNNDLNMNLSSNDDTDSCRTTNVFSKSKNASSSFETREDDKDSDLGDIDLPANNTDEITNSDGNKRLSVTIKDSTGSVKSVGSDSAIDSMDSCRLEPQDRITDQGNDGTAEFELSNISDNNFNTLENLSKDVNKKKGMDNEKDKNWQGKIVVQGNHKILPEDYSLAEHV